jgi:hypothetical protein
VLPICHPARDVGDHEKHVSGATIGGYDRVQMSLSAELRAVATVQARDPVNLGTIRLRIQPEECFHPQWPLGLQQIAGTSDPIL